MTLFFFRRSKSCRPPGRNVHAFIMRLQCSRLPPTESENCTVMRLRIQLNLVSPDCVRTFAGSALGTPRVSILGLLPNFRSESQLVLGVEHWTTLISYPLGMREASFYAWCRLWFVCCFWRNAIRLRCPGYIEFINKITVCRWRKNNF